MHELVTTGAALKSFCTFRLGTRLYGIEVAQVREVSPYLPMTPVPQVPAAIRGLFNLRSRIYLALDLRPLLGLTPTICTAESRLIILRSDILPEAGILVEQGGDIIHTKSELIEATNGAGDVPTDSPSGLITGVCKLENQLMMAVDLTRLNEIVMQLFR